MLVETKITPYAEKVSIDVRLFMFRWLFCTSLSHSNLHQRHLLSISQRNFQNARTLPFPTLNSPIDTCSVERLQNIHSFRRLSSLYSLKAYSRCHLSVSIPAVDRAGRSELLRSLESSLGSSFSSDSLLPNPNPLIIVLSGPGGVGKYTVIKKLKETREDLHFVVTATSRTKRPGEMDGKDYYFVTKEEFLSMVERDQLMEYALVYGDYKGVPKQQIRDNVGKGYDIVLRVDIQGAQTLRRILGKSAIFIFLVAENEMAMVERLIDRKTETAESLLVRIASAREEVRHVKRFDYVVVNAKGKLDKAVKQVESIIDAEKAKVRPRNAVI